jgi:RES domain
MAHVNWTGARRIIRSLHPPIDLFEDIADPADWPLLISAEQKTNPRLMESVGDLDLVPVERRVFGPGASWLMAPFTHASPQRASRFSDGSYGVLYLAAEFETALFETIHHHSRFMLNTREAPGWTSDFRELVLSIEGEFRDLRPVPHHPVFQHNDYIAAQILGRELRQSGDDGVVYPSQRHSGGQCAALFYPDLASAPVQGRHLSYHWDGSRVDLVREMGTHTVWRVG